MKDPGWKKDGKILVPDCPPFFDVERAEFAVKVRGFAPKPAVDVKPEAAA